MKEFGDWVLNHSTVHDNPMFNRDWKYQASKDMIAFYCHEYTVTIKSLPNGKCAIIIETNVITPTLEIAHPSASQVISGWTLKDFFDSKHIKKLFNRAEIEKERYVNSFLDWDELFENYQIEESSDGTITVCADLGNFEKIIMYDTDRNEFNISYTHKPTGGCFPMTLTASDILRMEKLMEERKF